MEKEIDLTKIWRIIKRRFWTLVLVAVLCLALGGAYVGFIAPRLYTTDVLLYIWQDSTSPETPNNSNYNELLYFSQLVNDYQVLIKSRLVTEMVAENLSLDESVASSLSDRITVGTKNNTRHITITVEDTDPIRATYIANTVADVFAEVVVETMNAGTVKIIDKAIEPQAPSSPDVKMSLAISLLIGIALGLGLIFLMEMLDTKVRSASDIEELTGYKMLGFVPLYDEGKDSREGRR